MFASAPLLAGAQTCATLTLTLAYGSTDVQTEGQVSMLQEFLGIVPATGYFGPITHAAVVVWQTGHGISPIGIVGPLTRASMRCADAAFAPQASGTSPASIPPPVAPAFMPRSSMRIVSDCALENETPVVTNWSAAAGGFSYLGSDAVQFAPTPIPSDGFHTGVPYYTYGSNFLPATDTYIADTWDSVAVSYSAVRAFTRALCKETGVAVKVLRPDASVANGRVASAPGYVQIVHGIPMFRSMFSVVLPPNWDASAPRGTYPIVAEGFYHTNWLVGAPGASGSDPLLAGLVADSGTGGKPGAIGIYWNGGGALGSYTINPAARAQFGEIIEYVARTYGGDPDRIAMMGQSRGGITALLMASNPDPHEYRVRYVFAAQPEVKLTALVGIYGSAFPAYYDSADWLTGFANAWTPGWTYPSDIGRPELAGLGLAAAVAKIGTGSSDVSSIDAHYAPIAPKMVRALHDAGTTVFFSHSTNDRFMPDGFALEYLDMLRQYAVPFEVQYDVHAGHGWDIALAKAKMSDAIEDLMAGRQPTVQNGKITYRRADRADGSLTAFLPEDDQPPFSVVAPQSTYTALSSVIYFSGVPGTQYRLQLRNQDTGDITAVSGTIGGTWDSVYRWNPNPGTYRYLSLSIKRPGESVWRYLSLRDTPTSDARRVFTAVTAGSPAAQSGTSLSRLLAANLNPVAGHEGITWGITHTTPSVPEGSVDFRLTAVYADKRGVQRELILSNENPSQRVDVDLNAREYSWGLEAVGADYTQPFSCIETQPNGTELDCSDKLWINGRDINERLQIGTYTFRFTYGGATYTRSVAINVPLVRTGSAPMIDSLSPRFGSSGSSVVIRGSNFTSAGNQVWCMSGCTYSPGVIPNAANLPSADGASISYLVPIASPGPYSIAIKNERGESNTATFVVTQ